jgi:hypothetical protein
MANLFDEEFDDAIRYISNTRMTDKIKRQHIQINIESYYTTVLVDCFAELGFYDLKSKAIVPDFSAWETLKRNLCRQRKRYSSLEAKRSSKICVQRNHDESSDCDADPIKDEVGDESDGSCSGSQMVSILD